MQPPQRDHLERELGFVEQEIWESGRELARAMLDARFDSPSLIPQHDAMLRHREKIQFMLGPRKR